MCRYRATARKRPDPGTRTYKDWAARRQAEAALARSDGARSGRANDHRFDVFRAEDATKRARQCGLVSRLLAHGDSRALRCRGRIFALRHCRPVSVRRMRGLRRAWLGRRTAQSKLEARYAVSLAGIPLGSGTWVIDITGDQYTAVANGRTTRPGQADLGRLRLGRLARHVAGRERRCRPATWRTPSRTRRPTRCAWCCAAAS